MTRLFPLLALALLAPFALFAAPSTSGQGFTVTRDSSLPPKEKFVLFEKGKPAGHLAFFSARPNHTFAVAADGSLQLRLTDNDPVDAGFRWAGGPGLPDSFSVSDYNYIVVTARLEGATRQTFGNGQVRSTRPDNLWNSFALFDADGKRVANAGLADVAGGKAPEQTVTLVIPMILFTYWGENPRPPIHGFGFQWGGARPPAVRDFTLVIDRVALAN